MARLLRVPWTARRSNQSILKEISPGCSLEGLMMKLKLQYFGHLMRRADSLEKTLMLWGTEGRRRGDDRGWDGWMASPTRWTWVWVNSGSWWWTGRPGVLQSMGSQRVGHDWETELNWTELNVCFKNFLPKFYNSVFLSSLFHHSTYFEIHPWRCRKIKFIPFDYCMIFHYISKLHFSHPLPFWWIFKLCSISFSFT